MIRFRQWDSVTQTEQAWPVNVTIEKLGDEAYGFHCPSIWGHNRATLQFNRDKLDETEQMATTAGHEFFDPGPVPV
ncbi:MAG: hypothetical protein U5K27_06070 [Desulfotignum sp.]|nr:hypothetical protein [Desulfotignum sp.]